MKIFKLIFFFGILLLTTTQCTDTQSSSNVDSALVGLWTETTGNTDNDNQKLNISFTSDGRCMYYYSYDVANNYAPGDPLTYWTDSDQIFINENQTVGGSLNRNDVGDYSIKNGELNLSAFGYYGTVFNGKILAK